MNGQNVIAVHGELEVEKYLLICGLSYRYCFKRMKKGKNIEEIEHYFQKYYPYANHHRMIEVPPYFQDGKNTVIKY